MNELEAKSILAEQIRELRTRSYAELRSWILEEKDLHDNIKGRSGVDYQVEVQVLWDAQPHHDIRVLASIDDGGWRACIPLCDSFIIASDGSFVGE